jgi:hypothetical protein
VITQGILEQADCLKFSQGVTARRGRRVAAICGRLAFAHLPIVAARVQDFRAPPPEWANPGRHTNAGVLRAANWRQARARQTGF